MRSIARKLVLLIALVGIGSTAAAQDGATTVLDGLYNPCGVAIQPETGTVFVADSGHLKIVRVVDGQAQDVVVGFGKDVYGKGPMYDIGPLGLAFLDKDTLVVGGGGALDGEEALFVFKVPEVGQDAISADAAVASMTLAATDEIKGEGNFYAIAVTDDAVFVTCNGDDTKGWVSRAPRDGNTLGAFERFLPTKEAVEVDAPVGITVSPRGELVVGQMGEITVPDDGLVTFYRPEDQKMLGNFAIGLSDITGIAYSPVTGRLYTVDFCWHDTTLGGLFELVRDKDDPTKASGRKVAALDKPTAMAFDGEGNLYVTLVGTGADSTDGSGKLVMFPADALTTE